jgi:uncharacterized FlaG/YvyC family protein
MTDVVQLVPTAPALSRISQPRPEPLVEPVAATQTDNRTSGDNNSSDSQHSGAHQGQAARHLTITRAEKFGSFVYRSIDGRSGDVLWQYPAEQMLRMSQHLRELEQADTRKHSVDEKA